MFAAQKNKAVTPSCFETEQIFLTALSGRRNKYDQLMVLPDNKVILWSKNRYDHVDRVMSSYIALIDAQQKKLITEYSYSTYTKDEALYFCAEGYVALAKLITSRNRGSQCCDLEILYFDAMTFAFIKIREFDFSAYHNMWHLGMSARIKPFPDGRHLLVWHEGGDINQIHVQLFILDTHRHVTQSVVLPLTGVWQHIQNTSGKLQKTFILSSTAFIVIVDEIPYLYHVDFSQMIWYRFVDVCSLATFFDKKSIVNDMALSPDKKWLAVCWVSRQQKYQLVLYRIYDENFSYVKQSVVYDLARDDGLTVGNCLRWFPDSSAIIYHDVEEGRCEIYSVKKPLKMSINANTISFAPNADLYCITQNDNLNSYRFCQIKKAIYDFQVTSMGSILHCMPKEVARLIVDYTDQKQFTAGFFRDVNGVDSFQAASRLSNDLQRDMQQLHAKYTYGYEVEGLALHDKKRQALVYLNVMLNTHLEKSGEQCVLETLYRFRNEEVTSGWISHELKDFFDRVAVAYPKRHRVGYP